MNNQSVNIHYNDQIKMKVSEVFQSHYINTQTSKQEQTIVICLIVFGNIIWNVIANFQNTELSDYRQELTIKIIETLWIVFHYLKKKTTQTPESLLNLGLIILLINGLITILTIEDIHRRSEQVLDQFTFFILINQYIYNRFSLKLHYMHQVIGISSVLVFQSIWGDHFVSTIKLITVQLVFILSKQLRQQRLLNETSNKIKQFNQELDQMKQQQQQQINKYQEEIDQKSQLQLQSRANDLVNKLKLIKFKQQCEIKNQMLKNVGQQQEKLQSMVSITEVLGKDEIDEVTNQHNQSTSPKLENFKRRASRTLSQNSDLKGKNFLFDQQQSHSDQDIVQGDNYITIDEIDDLLNLLTGKKDNIWLPKFLRSHRQLDCQNSNNSIQQTSKEDQFSQDAKKFILSHFTQREASFQYIDDIQDDVDDIAEKTLIDFNINYLQQDYTLNNLDQSQRMMFIEGSINLFKIFKVIQTLKITNLETLGEFSVKIESLYQNNFYHNSMHAIDVANSTAFFLQNGLSTLIDDFQATCLLISSLAHDIGHPGLNNGFMTANRCRLALLFNDQSVLENYHSFLLFQVLTQSNCNIIENLSSNEIKGFRKYCLNLILDTDLTRHFQLMNKFQNYLNVNESPAIDQQLIMSIGIKCADVGHGAKELKLHKLWSRRIVEEFFLQGDLEHYLKVPISPMCDRNQNVSKSQEGFLKAIVLPMFEAFSTILKNENIQKTCVDQVKQNIEYWQKQETDQKFMEETIFDTNSGLETLQKFLNEPLHIEI
ncbi:unnamed protein product [Paramecium pentaurelia]|uniref:Phosphodiesterase n=1 Tax=Paramecium pentaurelia TaxID=43138 RepID=A0A8S1U565_9CILI|nr:unnamed protein product [Paramecium pentaurelia]